MCLIEIFFFSFRKLIISYLFLCSSERRFMNIHEHENALRVFNRPILP